MGPRHELIEEIQKKAQVSFHMFSSERFLSFGSKLLKEEINETALEEIRELKKSEIKRLKQLGKENEKKPDEGEKDKLSKIKELREEYAYISKQIGELREINHMLEPV